METDSKLTVWKLLKQLIKPNLSILSKGIGSLIIVDIVGMLLPMCLKTAIDALYNPDSLYSTILPLALLMVVIAIVQAVFRYGWRIYFQSIAQNAVYDLRKMLFEHLLKVPLDYYSKIRSGDIMSRMTNDMQEIKFAFGVGTLIFLDSSFYLICIPTIMYRISPKLTVYTLIPLIVVSILGASIKNYIRSISQEIQIKLSDLSSKAEESISGIRIIKGFVTEQQEIQQFIDTDNEYVKSRFKQANFDSFFHPAIDLFSGISLIVLLYVGGQMVIEKNISIGTFMAFHGYMLMLNWPMRSVGMLLNVYQKGRASLERCIAIYNEPSESSLEQNTTQELPNNYSIEVSDLSYKYPENKDFAIKNINFKIENGKSIAITGPVGCGKSTLLKVIMKNMPQTSGTIKIGNVNSLDINTEKYRAMFSYVPQEVFLFSESIKDNILYTSKDKNDVEKAIKYANLAGLKNELDKFPQGIESMLGEKGVNISGGQKQRVSIARALQTQRPILILDDCTSAVDTETEKEIITNLQSNDYKPTKITVSHRMVSIQNADLILYMDNGQIIEQGTHEDLMRLNGRYATAWNKQRLQQ